MSNLDHILYQIDALPPQQKSALFLRLSKSVRERPRGRSGAEVMASSGRLDPVSAREMIESIEAGRERVDARGL